MSTLKRVIPVVLFVGLVGHWNYCAFAGQNSSLGTVQDNKKQLLENKSCPGCDLSGVNLAGLNLDRVNLTGANLQGANLSKARLHLAILNKVNLQKADLRGAGFGGSDLAEADLRGADLRGATFVGAYLVGTKVDRGIDLNQPEEELVSENAVPVSEEQGRSSADKKRDDQVEVATQQQPVGVKGSAVVSPPAEPGFFDKAIGSVTDLFGQDESEEKKALAEKAATSGTPAIQAPVEVAPKAAPAAPTVAEKDVVTDIAPVKKQVPAESGFFDKAIGSVTGLFGQDESEEKKAVAGKAATSGTPAIQAPVEVASKVAPAAPTLAEKNVVTDIAPVKQQVPAEPGFFDKAIGSVTGLFGQDESEEKKVVAEKAATSGTPAIQAPVEVAPKVAPAAPTLPEKDIVVADIAPVAKQQPVKKEEEVAPPATEPGFFDTAMESVTGLFGEGESEKKQVVAEKAGTAGTPVEVPVAKSVSTDKEGVANSVPPVPEEKKMSPGELLPSTTPEKKIDPAAETAKNKERLLDTKRCYECSLTGVDLTGKNMDSVDLEGADLTGSTLEGVDLGNANLKGAVLVKVNLRNADLRGADLYKANLSGADLTGAKLEGALLDDAQLSDTVGYEKNRGQ